MATFGGAGDALPLITAGAYLKGRKHRVTFVAGAEHGDAARRSGLDFVPLSEGQDHAMSVHDMYLLPTRYYGIFFRRYAAAWNNVLYAQTAQHAAKDLVLVTSDRPYMWADLLASRELRIPTIRIKIDLPWAPAVTPQPPHLPLTRVQARLNEQIQLTWSRDGGKQPRSAFNQIPRLLQSARRFVPDAAFWPHWFAPSHGSPRGIMSLGFVPPPQIPTPEQAVDLRNTLTDVGPIYVVFMMGTEGTTRQWAPQYTDVSVRVCQRLNCGGLFLGSTEVQADCPMLPDRFAWRKFLPLEEVLRGASAIVHHGGIGTAAMAVRLGIPQLIVPRMFAQPSNAEWFRRAGLCAVLKPSEYTLHRGCESIASLMTDARQRAIAKEVAARPGFTAEPGRVCEFFEQFAESRSRPRDRKSQERSKAKSG